MRGTARFLALLISVLAPCGCDQPFIVQSEQRLPGGQLRKEGGVHFITGEQEGEWTYYYENGAKRAQGRYFHDVQDGKWSYWFKNGTKEMQAEFAGERRAGEWTYFHPNGKARAQGSFDRGRETGTWSFWSPKGDRERQGDFQDGKPELRWTYWHAGDKKKAEGYHLDGRKVGSWTFWDPAGSESRKLVPLPEGYQLVQERWESGSLRREGFLKGGKPEGRWVTFHRSGRPRISGELRAGVASGHWTAWAIEGAVLAAGEVEAGKMTGEWRTWVNGEARPLVLEGLAAIAAPAGEEEWSTDELPELKDAEDVVATWISEACSAIDERWIVRYDDAPASPPPPPQLVNEVEQQASVPVKAQPELTELEKKRIENTVKFYSEGASALPRRPGGAPTGYVPAAAGSRGDVRCADEIKEKPLPLTRFHSAGGEEIDIGDFAGKKNVLMVILRGYAGGVCMYCAAQTKALATALDAFKQLNTEVLVVYPGPEGGLDAFKELYRQEFGEEPPPYTMLYDADLELVGKLNIAADLAKPCTLILDPAGTVKYCFVGKTKEDRPAVKQLIEEIGKLSKP